MRLLACSCLLGLSADRAIAQTIAITGDVNPALAPFDQLVTSLMQKYAIPGGQLAVTKNGRLVLAHGYGWADSGNHVAVQPETLFRIASLTKQLTSIAVLQLVQQGKLSLDDRAFAILSDIQPLPGAVEDSRLGSITIRNLLQHSGGWDRDGTSYDPMFDSLHIASVVGVQSPPSTRDIIRYMLGRKLDFTPGTRYVYSNFGYAVLGRIIEKLTGVSYEPYVRSNVLAPVGVGDMQIGQTLIAGRQPGEVLYYMEPGSALAQSVFAASPGYLPSPYGGFCLEAMDSHGGWLASAVDLLKFWNGIDGRRGSPLLTPSSIQLMTARPGIPDWSNTSYWYGMGFIIRPSGGDANWWHDGSLPGTRTWVVRTYNGYAWAALFNERMNDSNRDNQFVTDLDTGLWNASAAVSSWPTTDLFSSYPPNSNPLPALSALVPVSAVAGGPAFTLNVAGSGFIPASTVQWNGANRPTVFVSSTQLIAAISATDLSTMGTTWVAVSNPLPGGGVSAPLMFSLPSNSAPSLTGLVPAGVPAGGSAFTLTLNGSGFVPDSVVQWNGSSRPTAFVNSTQLNAAITSADIVAVGSYQVTVTNPSSGGGTAAMRFLVNQAPLSPQINAGGVVNNASYNLQSSSVAPGSIAALFGSNLTSGMSCLPPTCNPVFGSDGTLNTTLAGARVSVNGTPVPIFYAAPTQLGIQIPFEAAGASATISVSVAGQASAPATITLAPVSPGIFTASADGKGAGAITHADGSAVTTRNPAHPGEIVILYATGLGQVTPAVSTGALPAGASSAVAPVTLSVGGISVIPDFAGLAGCCVGLNQINARIPAGASSGDAVPVVLTIAGKSSNTATIAVR